MTITADKLPIHLAKGANIALRELDEQLGSITAALETSGSAGRAIDADVSVLLLGDDGQVRSTDDFVFYNQPVALGGAVHLRDKIRSDDDEDPVSTDLVTLELDSVPDEVQRIVLSASLDPSLEVTFGDAAAVRLRINRSDDATELLVFSADDASSELAWIFGEFYRRQEDWKFRAVGQGFDGGLSHLVTEFGVDVDTSEDDTESDPGSDAATTVPAGTTAVDVPPDQDTKHRSLDGSGPTAQTEDIAATVTSSSATAVEELANEADQSDTVRKVSVRRSVRPPKLPIDWDQTVPSDSDWQPARLFPVAGIGGAEEQERRATSGLLAVMHMVKEFGRSVVVRLGAPTGTVQTFIEVPFGLEDQAYRPDGVIRVVRGQRMWTALVEVKTSDAKLTTDQVDKYVDIARDKGFDAVVTISNQLTGSGDDHPVAIDRRKLKKVSLHHISWDQIRTEATLLAKNKKISDPTQLRILDEFLRYLSHPRSGLHGFTNMGPQWVKVRDAVRAQTLRVNDKGCAEVTATYDQLVQRLSLDLSALLGVDVTAIAPRNRADSTSRNQQLADSGKLFGSIKVPGAVDKLVIETDLRSEKVSCSIRVDAPREGRPLTRVNWLLRQIPDARDSIRVEAVLAGARGHSTAALLGAVRKRPEALLPMEDREIRAFRLSLDANMGPKKGSTKDGLVGSVHAAAVRFYADVVQNLRAWNSRAPKIQD